MPIVKVTQKKRDELPNALSIGLDVRITFDDDPKSVSAAFEKLVQILGTALTPEELRELLTEMQVQMTALLSNASAAGATPKQKATGRRSRRGVSS